MAGNDLASTAALNPGALPRHPCYGACGRSLHWRRWDEEMVVFDPATGSTHLLSAAAAEVLMALMEADQPMDAVQLAQRLLPGEDGAAPLAEDVHALQSVLQGLARLGLLSEALRP